LRQRFGRDIPILKLFQETTVAALAQFFEDEPIALAARN
jgi:hypothetical protein